MSSPKKLQVSGLWCASCASALEKRLSEHPEVNRVKVQFVTNTLELETQSGQEIDFHQLNDWIQDLGYRVSPLWDGESAGDKISEQSLWNQISPLIYLGITSFFSMWSLFFSIAYYLEKVHIWATLSGVAASVGSVIGLVPFTRMAWSHMKLKGVTIDLLIVVSTSLLLFLSWWSWAYDQRWMFFESTIMALALVLGARSLEHRLRTKLQKELWLPTRPQGEVDLWLAGGWQKASITKVKVGRRLRLQVDTSGVLRIEPPVDGELVSCGEHEGVWVDESFLPGKLNLFGKNGEKQFMQVLAYSVLPR
jgi:cation transport ATPase